MHKISSPTNEIFKWALKIVNGKTSPDETDIFVIEGEKLFREAVKSGVRVKAVFSDKVSDKHYDDCCDRSYVMLASLFKRLSKLPAPRAPIAFVTMPHWPIFTDLLKNAENILVLDGIQDPGNLGTIIRTAEAFNVNAVLLLENSCSPSNAKTIRAAMGSIFRIPVYTGFQGPELILSLKSEGFICIATALSGSPITSMPKCERTAFFFGSEGSGLDSEVMAKCDYSISIPLKNTVESLNVAVCTAIFLYEHMRMQHYISDRKY